MEAEFVEILRKLVSERGKDDLFDTKLCRAALADLTRNKYKRERNLLFLAVESGAAKAIDSVSADDLHLFKMRHIRKLQEEYGSEQTVAEDVVNMLALVLRGDNTTTVITQPSKPDDLHKPHPQTQKPVDTPKPPPQSASGKDFTEPQYGIEMVYVKGGTFMMGATPEQGGGCEDNEKPAHEVTLINFYIGKYPVTQTQWKAVMNNNPSHFDGDDRPVEQVGWHDAIEFIKKLNQNTGKNYRLPMEAEWEYAARGGNQSRGYKYSGSNDIEEVAWYSGNSGRNTHPVGTKKANELGIYDMSGNVFEWVNDSYWSYSGGLQTIHTGGSLLVGRGGSWRSGAGYARVSYRYGDPGLCYDNFGFRLTLSFSTLSFSSKIEWVETRIGVAKKRFTMKTA